MNQDTIKATACFRGDPSVGMQGYEINVTIQCEGDKGFKQANLNDYREEIRKAVKQLAIGFGDGEVPYVLLEDECFDCGCVVKQGVCKCQEEL